METEKEKKVISSGRAVIPSRSVGSVLNAYYFGIPWYLVFAWIEETKQFSDSRSIKFKILREKFPANASEPTIPIGKKFFSA